MDQVVKFLQPYQLHPVVDHFSVALLFVAVLVDLFAGSSPTRIWLRYTAVLLMILGALAAGGSFSLAIWRPTVSGTRLGQPARDVLHRHALLGEYLAISFGVLAVWRIMIQSFGFMAGSRAIYLIVAILGDCDPGLLGPSRRRARVRLRRGDGADGGRSGSIRSCESVSRGESRGPDPDSDRADCDRDVNADGDSICARNQRGQHADRGSNNSTVGRAECEHVMQTKTNPEQSLEVADRLFKSIERGDIAAIREIYAPDVKIWHNNDGATQTLDANLAVLGWVVANISEVAYTEIRRHATPTGFVQQHVMRGRVKASGKELRLPACIICEVENGRITRLDEYFDSAHIAVLTA